MIRKFFISHCHETGETYFQHLLFTVKTAGVLVLSGIALIVHGVFPFLFTTTASANIRQLNAIIAARAAKNAQYPASASSPLRKKAA